MAGVILLENPLGEEYGQRERERAEKVDWPQTRRGKRECKHHRNICELKHNPILGHGWKKVSDPKAYYDTHCL